MTNTTVTSPPSDHDPTPLAIAESKLSDPDDVNDDASDGLRDTMSTATIETDNQSSTHARSPAKKRNKRKTRNPTIPSLRRSLNHSALFDQDARAHYDSDSTPDDEAL